MALDFNALAKDIEKNLADRKGPLPDMGKDDRDMLFSAIAQAVVEHLQTNAVVEVSDIHLNVNPAPGIIK